MVLTLTEPNAQSWWVADAQNSLRWTGSQPTHFSVYISHPDPTVLVGRLILMRNQPLYQYYKIVTPYGFKAAKGYILECTSIADPKKIYTTSQPFDIRPKGEPRCPPPDSIRPSFTSYPSSSLLSNASTSSMASASVSGSRTSDGHVTHLTFEYGGAYVAGVHAAGVLCEGFRNVSLKDVEDGSAEGWIKLGTPPKRAGMPTFVVGGSDRGSIQGVAVTAVGLPLIAVSESAILNPGVPIVVVDGGLGVVPEEI